MIRLFFLSEAEEAPFRHALAEALPLYRDTPEAAAQRTRSRKIMRDFIAELVPPPATFAADFVQIAIAALGARLSDKTRSPRELEVFATATADMLIGWLKQQRDSNPRR